MHIDIDRLHRVAEGSLTGRQQGHTLLSVTMLAGLIAIESPIVYCVVDVYVDIDTIVTMISDVCKAYELPNIEWMGRLHFKCLNTKVFFVFNNNGDMLNGIPENTPIVYLYEKY